MAALCSQFVSAQTTPAGSPAAASPAAPAKRTDVYSVTFMHAVPGKASALEDWAKKAAASAPSPGHTVTLRHQSGSPWDYVAINHIGAKATVEASGNPQGPALRPLMDWHDDTFANGPSWSAFAKEMDLDEATGQAKSKESVYVVSVYRPVVGKDDALEAMLSEPPSGNDKTAGAVLLQHLEGGAWRFLSISRYKNYADYGASEADAVANGQRGSGPWYQLREVCAFHNDTVASAVATAATK